MKNDKTSSELKKNSCLEFQPISSPPSLHRVTDVKKNGSNKNAFQPIHEVKFSEFTEAEAFGSEEGINPMPKPTAVQTSWDCRSLQYLIDLFECLVDSSS